jgi:hypothetical protein
MTIVGAGKVFVAQLQFQHELNGAPVRGIGEHTGEALYPQPHPRTGDDGPS